MKKVTTGILAVLLVFLFASFSVGASGKSNASISFTPGIFAFEQAPSINFGKQQLKGRTHDYKAQTIKDRAILSDARGNNAGWSLKANLTVFQNIPGDEVLQGSVLIIIPTKPAPMGSMAKAPSGSPKNVEMIPGDGLDHTLWVAKPGEGAGRWNMNLNPENVVLRVPGRAGSLGEHKATMRWTLLDVPG